MITTPTVSGKPGQALTGLSCDLYPLIGSLTAPGPILGVPVNTTQRFLSVLDNTGNPG